MTREAMRTGAISVDTITMALLNAKGDLFVAASILGVTGREMDSYIRCSQDLQAFTQALAEVRVDPAYRKMTDEAFQDEIERVSRGYRLEATHTIHEIASIPLETADRVLPDGQVVPGAPATAAMVEVKLKAAVALRGTGDKSGAGTQDNNSVLAELNALYAESAPRIRSVRAVQIEFESR